MSLSRLLKFGVWMVAFACAGMAQADIFTTANIGNDGYILRTNNVGETSVFSSGYYNAQGIAFNSLGTMFVTDGSGGLPEPENIGGLYTVNSAGVKTVFATIDIPFGSGSIAIDPSDNIYVVDATSSILKYGSGGDLISTWSYSDYPTSMVFYEGNLYVTSILNNEVGYFDSLGDYHLYKNLPTYLDSEDNVLDFRATGMAVDGDGNFYVSGGPEENLVIKIVSGAGAISDYVTTGLSGPQGMQWNGTALVIADQACGCGPTNTIQLSNGAGGVSLISDLGEDYYPVNLVFAPVPERLFLRWESGRVRWLYYSGNVGKILFVNFVYGPSPE
ncbi:MAG: hypothetical protein ABI615_04015 [Chthoniobacterales bacterium]